MVDSLNFVSSIKRRVGWFVMLGIGALILLVLVVSVRSNVFAKKFYLFVNPPSASSFYEGQPVEFQGFAIGHIDSIELQHEGQVRISLRLLERYHHMIHQGAVIQFIKEGWLGEQVVELTRGDIHKPMLNSGETLSYETEASLDQLLIELKPAVANANVLLGELATLATWMNDPDGDLRVGMAGLRQITASLHGENLELAVDALTHTLGSLNKVVSDFDDKKVALRLADSLQMSANILHHVEPLSQTLGKEGPMTVKRINDVLGNIDGLASGMNAVVLDLAEMTPELPGLAKDSHATLKEMDGFLKTLNGSWLLGGGAVPEQSLEALPVAPPVLDMQP